MNKCQLYTNVSTYIYILHIDTYYGGLWLTTSAFTMIKVSTHVFHHIVCGGIYIYPPDNNYGIRMYLSYVVFMMTLCVYLCFFVHTVAALCDCFCVCICRLYLCQSV